MPITTTEQQLKDIIDQIEAFRFSGSDDQDVETAELYQFKLLVKVFKRAARGIRIEQLRTEAQNLADPETIHEAYDIHADISVMLVDIKNYLISPDFEPHDPPKSNGPMATLKAFISYSTVNKQIAGQVKKILEDHSVDSFLAHEDIGVSQKWKDRIVEELEACHIFVPLLSKEFIRSEWAMQEIGFAFSRSNILIIPLSMDKIVPLGFISHIQGKPIGLDHIKPELLIEPMVLVAFEMPRL